MGLMTHNPGAQPSDAQELTTGLAGLPSRKMFPASLTAVKDALAHALAAGAASAAMASGTATTAPASVGSLGEAAAAPPGLSRELERVLDDIEAAAASRDGGNLDDADASSIGGSSSSAGTAVAEPPVKDRQQQQQPKPAGPTTNAGKAGAIKTREPLQRRQQEKEAAEQQRRGGLSRCVKLCVAVGAGLSCSGCAASSGVCVSAQLKRVGLNSNTRPQRPPLTGVVLISRGEARLRGAS